MNFRQPKKLQIMLVLSFIYFAHVTSTKFSQCHGNWARLLYGEIDFHNEIKIRSVIIIKFIYFFFILFILFRVQAMTRTPPVYTVRWSSQISRLNNRLGPPTPAPNAVSAASAITSNILSQFYKTINLYNISHTINDNIYSSHSRNKMITDQFDELSINTIFTLLTYNKFSCLAIIFWFYNFIIVQL